jgi:hypothetical protein
MAGAQKDMVAGPCTMVMGVIAVNVIVLHRHGADHRTIPARRAGFFPCPVSGTVLFMPEIRAFTNDCAPWMNPIYRISFPFLEKKRTRASVQEF